MSAWIDVYCRRPDVELDPDELFRAVDDADLVTLAEVLELPEGEEAAVEAARPYLRADWAGDAVNFYWKPGRPLRLEAVHGDDARDDVAAVLADLPPSCVPRVREHLAETRTVVYIQLGLADTNHLAATIGEVLAFHLADIGDGLVRFYDREWAAPDNRGVTIWTAA